jgi:glycosyltransferase involved in cell wall biosynthesis
MTSLHEGFSLSSLEALAFGLPLLSTRVSGTVEFLKDGENGFFIDYTPEDVAKKMHTLVEAPPERLRLFEASAKKTANTYSLDAHIRAHEELFVHAARQ